MGVGGSSPLIPTTESHSNGVIFCFSPHLVLQSNTQSCKLCIRVSLLPSKATAIHTQTSTPREYKVGVGVLSAMLRVAPLRESTHSNQKQAFGESQMLFFFRNELQIFCKRVLEKRKSNFAFMQNASFC